MSPTCPICNSKGYFRFEAKILNKYSAKYFLCEVCEYLWIHDPQWLDEAYSSAIADSDTGLVMRNLEISKKLASLLYGEFHERGRGKYLDAAGGYGLLTRLMRDGGFNFYWQDKYCVNLLARGFEYSESKGICQAVTAFEVLEHLTNPREFISDCLKRTGATAFIFSTELYEGLPPAPNDWWYYSLKTGQHIGFFTKKTLFKLAKQLEMNYYHSSGIHLLTSRPCNVIKIRFLTNKYFSYFYARWAKFSLGTKTFSDSQFFIQD